MCTSPLACAFELEKQRISFIDYLKLQTHHRIISISCWLNVCVLIHTTHTVHTVKLVWCEAAFLLINPEILSDIFSFIGATVFLFSSLQPQLLILLTVYVSPCDHVTVFMESLSNGQSICMKKTRKNTAGLTYDQLFMGQFVKELIGLYVTWEMFQRSFIKEKRVHS